jgi:hypothetical protein
MKNALCMKQIEQQYKNRRITKTKKPQPIDMQLVGVYHCGGNATVIEP